MSSYVIGFRPDGERFIRCVACDATSFHPIDIRRRYCARCGVFHDEDATLEEELAAVALALTSLPLADRLRLAAKLLDMAEAVGGNMRLGKMAHAIVEGSELLLRAAIDMAEERRRK